MSCGPGFGFSAKRAALIDPVAGAAQDRESSLRLDIALRRRPPKPFRGLFVIASNALPSPIHFAEETLRFAVALIGSLLKPFCRRGEVLRHAVTVEAQGCKRALCCDVPAPGCVL